MSKKNIESDVDDAIIANNEKVAREIQAKKIEKRLRKQANMAERSRKKLILEEMAKEGKDGVENGDLENI